MRERDPYAYASVSPNELDTLYHADTDFDAKGPARNKVYNMAPQFLSSSRRFRGSIPSVVCDRGSNEEDGKKGKPYCKAYFVPGPNGPVATRFKKILALTGDVFERVKKKHGSKQRFKRLEVTSVVMYLQDLSTNPQVQLEMTKDQLAERILKHHEQPIKETEFPSVGKTTSSSRLQMFYKQWLQTIGDAAVRLDPRRLFDEQQKRSIRTRDGGLCKLCGKQVADEDAEYDHYPIPYHAGGLTDVNNGRLVCKTCHPRGPGPTEEQVAWRSG